MKKGKSKQPFLNSLARNLGHVAGSVVKAAPDFTANDAAYKAPELPAKAPKLRVKTGANKRQYQTVATRSRGGAANRATKNKRQRPEKKR
jgi:hypothetical protein